jgi:hypothetical protein
MPACPLRQPCMVFLFVGSSALTEASFPRDLAIPQLLLSSACAIVLTMKVSPTAAFPHRGLAPLQFTPMSGAHHAGALCGVHEKMVVFDRSGRKWRAKGIEAPFKRTWWRLLLANTVYNPGGMVPVV